MEQIKQSYLTVDIYRSDYNCPINFYDKDKRVLCPIESGWIKHEELAEFCSRNNINNVPVKIVKRKFNDGEYIHAEPNIPGSWAFGGSYIETSDSRFGECVNKYPVPLHDRDMSLEK